MNTDIKNILENVKSGAISVDGALLQLKMKPFEDIGYAKVDMHRKIRQGAAEVIYGEGKTSEQMIGIIDSMKKNGQESILITRLSEETANTINNIHPITYYKDARCAVSGKISKSDGIGKIVVATGGTSDIPVAEEAAITAEVLGNEVVRLYDVGVAGIHRMLAHLDDIMSARVIIAIAGMEGALASVIGGLADCPVIAVPTSVGYGASFNGLSALLSMLNSCASGVSVVNIDNGFGAGYDNMIAKRKNEIENLAKKIDSIKNLDETVKKRKAEIKNSIDILDGIIKDGAVSNANLRLLISEIIILEQDNELSIVVAMKAPFGEYYGELFDEEGNIVLAHSGDYKSIA